MWGVDAEDLWWMAPLVGFVGVLFGGAITGWVSWWTGNRALAHASKLADDAAAETRAATDLARQQEARARIYLDLLPAWSEARALGRGTGLMGQMRRLAWIAGDEDDLEARVLDHISDGGADAVAPHDIEVAVLDAFWTNVGNRLKGLPDRVPLPSEVLDAIQRGVISR
jgi:hypothetical protein